MDYDSENAVAMQKPADKYLAKTTFGLTAQVNINL